MLHQREIAREPTTEDAWEEEMRCENCDARRRFLVESTWAGTKRTCLRCGDSWRNDRLESRPFKAGWRGENVYRAISRMIEYGKRPGGMRRGAEEDGL